MDNYRVPKRRLKIEVLNRQEERTHFHQDIELLFVLQGTLTVIVDEMTITMNPEDIFVVNANKYHSICSENNVLYSRFVIQWQLISDVFQNMEILFWCDSTRGENEHYTQLRKLLKELLKYYLTTGDRYDSFGYISLCYQIIDLLSVHFLVHSSEAFKASNSDKYDSRIAQINNYIRANYDCPISLNDLAERLYLSVGYLSRFFKKTYGMNFAEYLENIRMHYALEELLYSDTAIMRIAYNNGFASVAAFNKAFKAMHGETPSVMRKRHLETMKDHDQPAEKNAAVDAQLEVYLRETEQSFRLEPAGDREETEIIIGDNQEKIVYFWNETINIGSAMDLLNYEVREHVIQLRQDLNFKYIRFANIFSAKMLLNTDDEEGGYNFSHLDANLEFILDQNLKPHIELGLKPKVIHGTIMNLISKENDGPNKMAWPKYLQAFEALMKHLVQHYGRAEIDTWRMEYWLDESTWYGQEGKSQYLQQFAQLWEVLKSYSKEIQLGGCGLLMDRLEDTIEGFLLDWQQSGRMPDFLSAAYYGYERYEENRDDNVKRTTDNDFMTHSIQRIKQVMSRTGFGNVPLYLTEWNLTISDRNYINDTCFKGAYIVKNLLDIYGKVDMAAYYMGSDRVSEYYDTNSLLFGGMGLIAKDSILKPAGYAFEFMNRLYPFLVSKGRNYLMTTNKKDDYSMICHNQKSLNYNYYFADEDKIDKAHVWKYFEDRDTLELKVNLNGMADGLYKLKIYKVNEHSGSLLEVWASMDFEEDLSRNDIRYLRHLCQPRMTMQKIEVVHQLLHLSLELKANEFAFVHLRRLF